MRLISCNIESFGKLHKKTFEFDNKLEVIKEDNSWGKTTLAEFISGMFYGLPSLKNKQISENERLHYDPWQGGVYGGSLTFEYDGKNYRIERDFNRKDDDFKLIDLETKRVVDKIDKKNINSKNIGESLFNLNKSSFTRSIYLPQGDIAFNENKNASGQIEEGLNEKLRNLINATDGKNNFNNAIDILEKAEHFIETKSGKGQLYEVIEKIKDLKNKIDKCNVIAANADSERIQLNDYNKKLSIIEITIEKNEQKIKTHNESAKLLEQQSHYNRLVDSIGKILSEINKLKLFFGDQKITDIKLDKIEKLINDIENQNKILHDLRSDTQKEKIRLEFIEKEKAIQREKKEILTTQIKNVNSERKKVQDEINELEKKIKPPGCLYIFLYILSFGILWIIRKNKEKILKNEINEYKNKLFQLDKDIDDLHQKLKNIPDIKEDDINLNELNSRLNNEENTLKTLSNDIDMELKKYNCKEKDYKSQYWEIKRNHENYIERCQNYKTEKNNLAEFLQEKDEELLKTKIESGPSSEQLQNEKRNSEKQKDDLKNKISDLKTNINNNDIQAASLSDYISEKENYEQIKSNLQGNLDIIKKTIEYLEKAKDNLSAEYLNPLRERCCELIKMFDSSKAILDFDADSCIKIKEDGKERELDYFSEGNKELISICMRFALTDLIYKDNNQKPFMILDDPFVNLDDNKLKMAKEFILKLSENYQIIYLTCHDSRKIIFI